MPWGRNTRVRLHPRHSLRADDATLATHLGVRDQMW